MISLVLFCVGSMSYAYAYRGQARWNSFGEYIRKGWPMFTPFNCLLYLFTRPKARSAVMDMEQFPELKELQDNWQTIGLDKWRDSLYLTGSQVPMASPLCRFS